MGGGGPGSPLARDSQPLSQLVPSDPWEGRTVACIVAWTEAWGCYHHILIVQCFALRKQKNDFTGREVVEETQGKMYVNSV